MVQGVRTFHRAPRRPHIISSHRIVSNPQSPTHPFLNPPEVSRKLLSCFGGFIHNRIGSSPSSPSLPKYPLGCTPPCQGPVSNAVRQSNMRSLGALNFRACCSVGTGSRSGIRVPGSEASTFECARAGRDSPRGREVYDDSSRRLVTADLVLARR